MTPSYKPLVAGQPIRPFTKGLSYTIPKATMAPSAERHGRIAFNDLARRIQSSNRVIIVETQSLWSKVSWAIIQQDLPTPLLRDCAMDALKLAAKMPATLPDPEVWSDGEIEIAFEWILPGKHALVSFDGDGAYGYTMKVDGRFIPGRDEATVAAFPKDLADYLHG